MQVWKSIGKESEDTYHYNKYINGDYTYDEWLNVVFNIFKDSKVNKKIFNDIAINATFIDNLEDFLVKMKSAGIKLYVLSGGIKNIIDIHLIDVNKYFESIEAYGFSYDDKGCINQILYPNHNPEKKNEFVSMVIRDLDVKPNEVLFVGNGSNDETVYLSGARTLCLNPDDAHWDNKTIWHNCINTNNILDIIEFL